MVKVQKVKKYCIGIDVGGTKMNAVLFNGTKVIADYVLATPQDNLEHFLIMLKALIEPLQEKAKNDKIKINGIGMGVAGVLDSEGRKMLHSPNLPIINGVKVADKLEELIGVPVRLDNDADAFVRAEAMIGAGQGYDSVYGITVGTGIGGGWWINNDVHNGSHGGAGEVSDTIIDLSSGLTLEETYQKLTQNNPAKLAQEAYRGDPLAEQVYEEIGAFFGIALANIVNLIDPEVFVIGGSVADSSDLFFSTLKKNMKERIESSEAAKKVKVLKSKLGKDAGAIGAACLV